MIDGARRFAVRWLLEPTKQDVEPHYEYVFRLVTYHGQEIVVTTKDETKISSDTNYHVITNTLSPDFPIIRAEIYRVTNTREYIGTVEYYGLKYFEEYSLYSNSNTGITEENTKYVYLLNSLYLSPNSISVKGLTSYITGDIIAHKSINKTVKSGTEELVREKTIEQQFPSEVFTAEFHSFSDDTYFDFSHTSSYSKISLTGISYPKFTSTNKFITVYPNKTTESTEIYEYDAIKNGQISFNVYSPYASYIDDFDKYQDKLYTPLDSKISAPTVLVKCSDGLDFATFKLIGNETQYFSKNTTITFEHD